MQPGMMGHAARETHQLALARRPILVGVGHVRTVAHNTEIEKKKTLPQPLHPLVVFQLNEIIFPRLETQSGSEGLRSACCLLCVQKRR